MTVLGGLDIGTTGAKLTAYTEKGELLGSAYREYDVKREGGFHEVDARVIFEKVCEVLSEVGGKYPLSAIGVTSFGETFVLTDEEGEPLLPAMLYTDARGEEECAALVSLLGDEKITRIAGVKAHHMFSLPKLMWIKAHEPEIYARAKYVFLMGDYIIYRLTGERYINHSLAARTMAFDIREKCFSDEILSAAGIDKALFSTPADVFTVAGEVKEEVADRLDIPKGIKITVGAHDQVAATVGAGILEPGCAMDGAGTVECIVPLFDTYPDAAALARGRYPIIPYVFPDTYVTYAFSFTGGAVLKWYRDNLSAEKSYAVLDGKVKDAPSGILVLPHFAGAATPYMDMDSRAAFLGLTVSHDGADLYKALMEGVAYEARLNLDMLAEAGIKPRRLYATGGGASDVWLGIKADVWQTEIVSLEAGEVGACGACMLAGVATGVYKDLYEAKAIFVKEKKVYTPTPRAEQYQKLYHAYRDVYAAVRPITEKLK